MAPEVLLSCINTNVMFENYHEYDKMSDWWSFGITMYKLLTNKYPFVQKNIVPSKSEYVDSFSRQRIIDSSQYKILLGEINLTIISDLDIVDFISNILKINKHERLGNNVYDIYNHQCFSSIDWNLIHSAKHPSHESCYQKNINLNELNKHDTLHKILKNNSDLHEQLDNLHNWKSSVKYNKDQYFNDWNYVSDSSIRHEMNNLFIQ